MIDFSLTSALPSPFTLKHLRASGRVLAKALRSRKKVTIGVRFVNEREIRTLNRVYRKKDRPTDVLSFSHREEKMMPKGESSWGDLVICPSYARAEAKRRAIPFQEELVRLLVHGTLHLAGYDHATQKEEERMFALQERCLEHILNHV